MHDVHPCIIQVVPGVPRSHGPRFHLRGRWRRLAARLTAGKIRLPGQGRARTRQEEEELAGDQVKSTIPSMAESTFENIIFLSLSTGLRGAGEGVRGLHVLRRYLEAPSVLREWK